MNDKNQILSMGITIPCHADDNGRDLAAAKNTGPDTGSVFELLIGGYANL